MSEEQANRERETAELRRRVAELEAEVARLRAVNDELSERTLELFSLFELSYSLGSGIRYDRLKDGSMDFLGDLLGIDQFSLMLLDPDDGKLHIRAALGIPKSVRRKCVLTPPEGIAGMVFTTGQAVYVPDVSREPRYLYYKGAYKQGGSLISLPLLDEDDKPFGVLNISKPEIDAFSESDQKQFGALAFQIAVIIQNFTSYTQLHELSQTDELTSLANRRSFFESLEVEHDRHTRVGKSYTLLLIDVDFFKQYNDRHGHLEGDRALRELAALLKKRGRQTDILARYGGEEFVVCATRTTKQDGIILADALRTAIAEHRFLLADGRPAADLSITVGVASYPDDAAESLQVLAKADQALFVGKTRGRNTVAPYTPDIVLPETARGAKGDDPGRRGKGELES
ncbi:MAG: diguanylate cyclase [Myxococcales bacterium]|nr:diguanylate cyclase [Myxococcales bacterium]